MLQTALLYVDFRATATNFVTCLTFLKNGMGLGVSKGLWSKKTYLKATLDTPLTPQSCSCFWQKYEEFKYEEVFDQSSKISHCDPIRDKFTNCNGFWPKRMSGWTFLNQNIPTSSTIAQKALTAVRGMTIFMFGHPHKDSRHLPPDTLFPGSFWGKL